MLRSQGAIAAEQVKQTAALFDATQYLHSDVVMLVYSFGGEALDLSIVGTRRVGQSKHKLQASGQPVYVGTWPYDATSRASSFDQHQVDAFKELGDLDLNEVSQP